MKIPTAKSTTISRIFHLANIKYIARIVTDNLSQYFAKEKADTNILSVIIVILPNT